MKKLIKTRAFILGARKFQETSNIYSVLTEKYGRRDVVAKGIRKSGSKHSGIMSSFMMVEVVLSEGRNMDTLCDSCLLHDYRMLEKNLIEFGVGSLILEIINRASKQEDSEVVFGLLADYLGSFERNKDLINTNRAIFLFMSSFIMSILAVSGRLPIVDSCYFCSKPVVENKIKLSVQGVKHQDCDLENDWSININLGTVELLRKTVCLSCDKLIKDNISAKDCDRLFSACLYLYYSFFEGEVNSINFLEIVMNKKNV